VSTAATSTSDVHLFAYLACLLSLYSGRTPQDWGYSFAATSKGYPFAHDIADSLQSLLISGCLHSDTNGITISSKGEEEYQLNGSLGRNGEREIFLAGACSAILAMPLGMIRWAISEEPELKRARVISDMLLLQPPGVLRIYDHLQALSKAVGEESSDLMVPAVAWLSFLAKKRTEETRE